jgi:urease accessory protein
MMRATSVLPAGTWDDARAVDTVLLEFDLRHRRRLMLHTEAGAELLLDLSHAARLREGDGLVLETGGVVRVWAKPEPLLEIYAHDPGALVRIAWHLGNRHLRVQLLPGRIRIRPDHVIADMVRGLGGHVEPVQAAFDPEAGAYASGHHHHGHDDEHAH